MPGDLAMDSDLDASSQYPSHGGFTTPAARLIVETRGVARGFLSYYHVLPSSCPRVCRCAHTARNLDGACSTQSHIGPRVCLAACVRGRPHTGGDERADIEGVCTEARHKATECDPRMHRWLKVILSAAGG